MEYKVKYFDDYMDLKDYLNENKIYPKSIISILCDNSLRYGRIILIYYSTDNGEWYENYMWLWKWKWNKRNK